MNLLERFLDPASVSLKICGVTLAEEASRLAEVGVDAIGVNFWPKSKRYLAPDQSAWLEELAGKILRVGVFVNPDPESAIELLRQGRIDVIQLHGDETPEQAAIFREGNIPFIKAIGVGGSEHLVQAADYGAQALLLDAHAPGVYGGTGETFDWNAAVRFKRQNPQLPVILAGGIVPENAREAASVVHPVALDVASGAERSPGRKDFEKVGKLLNAIRG